MGLFRASFAVVVALCLASPPASALLPDIFTLGFLSEVSPDEVDRYSEDGATCHVISAITPVPPKELLGRLGDEKIPLDTWVELTFVDDEGNEADPITRTYRFRLQWEGPQPVPGKYVLETTYLGPWGRRINDIYIFQVSPQKLLLKEEMESQIAR